MQKMGQQKLKKYKLFDDSMIFKNNYEQIPKS